MSEAGAAPVSVSHRLAAHCESGVASLLFEHAGVSIPEPLVFGAGSGLFFLHLPIERFTKGPTVSFRTLPGTIFKKACRRLGVRYETTRYRSKEKAHSDLCELVDSGKPVGLQVSVYWLPYLPRRFRFQFNAHNLIVYGRQGSQWLISDPVLDAPVECPADALERARFAAGVFAPRGRMYRVLEAPTLDEKRLRGAIVSGVRETAHRMAKVPVPILGARGIRHLARSVALWPKTAPSADEARLRLANVVRMLEEIGTGGAGFRYLYAAFLQQAGDRLHEPGWGELSERLTAIGDRWRDFSLKTARILRAMRVETTEFGEAAALLDECGNREQSFFEDLHKLVSRR